MIEITDKADAECVRCPYGKIHAALPVHRDRMRAEILVDVIADPCAELFQNLFRYLRFIVIGIPHGSGALILITDLQPVIRNLLSGEQRGEEAILIDHLHLDALFPRRHAHRFSSRKKCLDQHALRGKLSAQKAVRLVFLRINNSLDTAPIHQIIQFFLHRYTPESL